MWRAKKTLCELDAIACALLWTHAVEIERSTERERERAVRN